MGKLKETLQNLAKLYKKEIQNAIRSEDLEYTGGLYRSISYRTNKDGFSISSDKKYAHLLGANGYLKRWRRPPAEELAEWALSKGFRPRDKKGRFKKITESSKRGLGFMLAKSIDEKGTAKRFGYRGSRIIQKVNQKLENIVEGEITEAYKLELVEGMKQDFKFKNIEIR